MKPDQYETEAHRWALLKEAVDPRGARELTTAEEASRAGLAKELHDAGPPVAAPKWYTGPVRDVGVTDNEGRYEKDVTGGFWRKSLDTGHWLVDEWEKVTNNKKLMPYDGQWQHLKVLPPARFYSGTRRRALIGANGWELSRGTYMFVICSDGALRYFPNDDSQCERPTDGKHYVQYLPHAALAHRESVLAAGNLGVSTGGTVDWAASNSGHYRVDDRMCEHNLLACLKALGYAYGSVHEPDSSGTDLGDGTHYLCFYKYPKWRFFQQGAKSGMTALLQVRPSSNLVTTQITQALDALERRKRAIDPVRHRISSASNNVVFDSIGDESL